MLIDIDLEGHLAIIAGAGTQAYRRAKSLLDENCRVIVIGQSVDERFDKISSKNLTVKKQKIDDASFVFGCGARLVVAATDNEELNAIIVNAARKEPNCLAYTADGASKSDYSHVATAKLADKIEFALSTCGQSPTVAKSLRDRASTMLEGLVTETDKAQIHLYSTMRAESRRTIPTSRGRQRFIQTLADDHTVQQLIKDGRTAEAQERAMEILKGWQDVKDHC